MKPSHENNGFSSHSNTIIWLNEWIWVWSPHFMWIWLFWILYGRGNWLNEIIYLPISTLGERVKRWSCRLEWYYCLNRVHGQKPLLIQTNLKWRLSLSNSLRAGYCRICVLVNKITLGKSVVWLNWELVYYNCLCVFQSVKPFTEDKKFQLKFEWDE